MIYTYFILAGTHVKIGRSRNPKARLGQISTSCPVLPRLLKIADISEKEAHQIARRISRRTHGEWFEYTPALQEWLHGLVSPFPQITTTLKFDPKAYPERILRLIMRKAEEWACPPSEALSRLLDKLADDAGVPDRKEGGLA